MNVPTTSGSKSNGRIQWPESPSLKQYFSLPDSIMYYMAMNPSTPEVYNKLIQSCKYFFERNPILVVNRMNKVKKGTSICANGQCVSSGGKPCCVKIDINKIKSKFWLTRELNLSDAATPNFISLLLPKLFRCEIDKLQIWQMNILFGDFKYLALFAKSVELVYAKIVNSDGKVVMLEKILESVSNIEEFYYIFRNDVSMVTHATIKNILKLQNLGKIKIMSLQDIPQVFNVEDLSRFITEFKDTTIWLGFVDIAEEYMIQLDALIDTVIQSDVPNRSIRYVGQDKEKLAILEERCHDDHYAYEVTDDSDASYDDVSDEDMDDNDDEDMDDNDDEDV
uniref:DUF38 domain-containing protein n=1 Tax=Panagrolaimus sp. ES5 TaxID=591445 RepID=A0AC34GYC8_9BILA